MAALLTSETSKPENVVKYIQECREMSISVTPPNVQVSETAFTPVGDTILFGLAAIKNVGHNAIQSVIDMRGRRWIGEGKSGFCESLGVLREGGSAAAEQEGVGVLDQGWGRWMRLGLGRAGDGGA